MVELLLFIIFDKRHKVIVAELSNTNFQFWNLSVTFIYQIGLMLNDCTTA